MTTDDGNIHICFLDPVEHILYYGINKIGQNEWKLQKIEDVGPHNISVSRIWPKIKVGPDYKVFVTYKKYVEDPDTKRRTIYLKLATYYRGLWDFETIENTGFIDGLSELDVDTKGNVHIVYSRAKPGNRYDILPDMNLIYATQRETSWIHEVVDTIPEDGGSFSFSLDANDNPCLLVTKFKRIENKFPEKAKITLLKKQSDIWSTMTLAENTGTSCGAQIKFDLSGRMHIVFPSFDENNKAALVLKHASNMKNEP